MTTFSARIKVGWKNSQYNDLTISLFADQLPILLKVFSARANSRTIFRIVENKSNPNVIDCLSGIRCMSLFWVVYCHEYVTQMSSVNINYFEVLQVGFKLFQRS